MKIFSHYCNEHVIYLVIPLKPWGVCLFLIIPYKWHPGCFAFSLNPLLVHHVKKNNSLHFHIPVQKTKPFFRFLNFQTWPFLSEFFLMNFRFETFILALSFYFVHILWLWLSSKILFIYRYVYLFMLYDKCIILFLTFKNWTYLTFDISIKSYCLNKLVTVVFTSNVWNVKPIEMNRNLKQMN